MKPWKAGLIAVAVLAVQLLLLSGCENERYPSGRDTRVSFGDGRFQIMRQSSGGMKLRDVSNTTDIGLNNLADWRQEGDWVYAVNKEGEYAVLNFRTAEFATYKSLEAIPQAHKKFCGELKR